MLKTLPALAAVVVAAALVVPTVSLAAQTSSVRVSYADLNLVSPVARHTLQQRIVYAARVVCEIEDSRELALQTETEGCRSDAVERARPAYEAAIGAALRPSVTVGASLIVTAR
jgi:UrcA family protein